MPIAYRLPSWSSKVPHNPPNRLAGIVITQLVCSVEVINWNCPLCISVCLLTASQRNSVEVSTQLMHSCGLGLILFSEFSFYLLVCLCASQFDSI